MDFTAFDTQKIKDYAAQAKQQWLSSLKMQHKTAALP